ncbi:MAG TPA: hypothetical protein VMR34_05420 [Candidatus Saccharimonadales bacterium]|nr:hypothetical protein [Candidatus Saccharimonadales bacterium]
MSTNNQPQPTEPQEQAANKGVAVKLSAEALHNLAGWFDVLIQMDLAQKVRNEIRSKNDEKADIQDASSKSKEVH